MNKIDYHELQSELDEILRAFEDPNLDIDKALQSYDRAVTIVGQLEKYLENAENKIHNINTKLKSAD